MVNIAICDDDNKVLTRLSEMADYYFMNAKIEYCIFRYSDPIAMIEESGRTHFDLVLLDIMLGPENGVDIAVQLREITFSSACMLCYISSAENYSQKLIKTHPEDYLLKPILATELYRIFDKCLSMLSLKQTSLPIKSGSTTINVPIHEILFIESIKRKCIVYTKNERYSEYAKLSDIESAINDVRFILIHKSYLVNIRHCESYNYSNMILDDGTTLPISQGNRKEVRVKVAKLMGISKWT